MKLENQVVSLEIAKRLKELGVKQESAFQYEEYSSGVIKYDTRLLPTQRKDKNEVDHFWNYYSAFSAAELGEMLPCGIHTWKWEEGNPTKAIHWAGRIPQEDNVFGSYDTEANARGKMLIYLLENNLIVAEGK